MLAFDTVKIKWHNKTRKYYEDKGYIFTKYGDEFEVKISDLPPGSNVKIDVLCDYCLENGIKTVIKKEYYLYLKAREIVPKDCCSKCVFKKNKEVNLIKYGCENSFQREDVKEKIKQTFLERYGATSYTKTKEYKEKVKKTNLKKYGVVNPMQNEEIKNKAIQTNLKKYGVSNVMFVDKFVEKIKNTMLTKYGVENYSQTEDYKIKFMNTSLKKWGVPHPFQSEEIKYKIYKTNMERYGYPNALKNPKIKKKLIDSFYKNGTCKTSSQQKYIYHLLKENGYNVELNYPLSNVNLDIALFIGNTKIDIEYDGTYWHQDKNKDRKRDEFVKSQGWKVFRIVGQRAVPTLKQLEDGINTLLNTDKNFIRIYLDDVKEAI